MAEARKVPAAVIVEAIARISNLKRLDAFIEECQKRGYSVEVPQDLYNLAVRTMDDGKPHILKGSGVCNQY